MAGAAPLPSDRGNSLDEWEAMGHVVRVRSGQDDRERNPLCLRHDMMLTPQLPSIRRIRPRFPPEKGLDRRGVHHGVRPVEGVRLAELGQEYGIQQRLSQV